MSLNDRLAAYLRAREGRWLDGMEIARVAGSYAWRSRLSDLRRAPYSFTIENRVRVVPGRQPLSSYKISEYRLVPAAPQAQEHSA